MCLASVFNDLTTLLENHVGINNICVEPNNTYTIYCHFIDTNMSKRKHISVSVLDRSCRYKIYEDGKISDFLQRI